MNPTAFLSGGNRRITKIIQPLLTVVLIAAAQAAGPAVDRTVRVYSQPGRYAGWPANHGIWSWDNEILVGFSGAYFKWLGPDRHPYDRDRSEEPYLARSLDGGKSWTIEPAPELATPRGMYARPGASVAATDLPGPLNFTHPDFCMTLRMEDAQKGESWLYYSYDRGKSWRGPFRFPLFGQKAIMARTDYLAGGKHDALVFLTASKSSGAEGRPLAVRTSDGGLHWRFVGWIAPDPGAGFTIMPSSVRLSTGRIVTAVRHFDPNAASQNSIDLYGSDDNGETWRSVSRAVALTGEKGGNPPSLIRLRDGRLALTYGPRNPPYRICARLSADNGATWSPEIVLRDGAASWDIGYTRSIQCPDGTIVTLYYWPPGARKERTLEATIWSPGKP